MQAVIFDLDDTLFASENALHDGVSDLLAILHRLGITVGALSGGDHRMLVRLDEAGIRHQFDHVVCREHVAEPKDPLGVQHLMRAMGVERHNVTLISHAHADITLGKHAGVARTIHVAHGPTVAVTSGADHVIEDIPTVLDVLE